MNVFFFFSGKIYQEIKGNISYTRKFWILQESWGTYKQGYLQFVNIWHIVHIIINDLLIFPFDLHTWKYLLSSDKCDTNILSSLFDFLRDVNMHVWFPVKKSLFRIAGISYFNTTVMSLILVFTIYMIFYTITLCFIMVICPFMGPLIWTNKILSYLILSYLIDVTVTNHR